MFFGVHFKPDVWLRALCKQVKLNHFTCNWQQKIGRFSLKLNYTLDILYRSDI